MTIAQCKAAARKLRQDGRYKRSDPETAAKRLRDRVAAERAREQRGKGKKK